MLCDAVSEEEIFEAYLLYASLHGMPTGEEEVRQRITSYLNNVPDSIIDEALLAYAEDRIIAPPDVVLPQWGRSRIYELVQTPQQEWRHQVCESWFENDCEFHNDSRDPELYHYWTQVTLNAEFNHLLHSLIVGTRLQFRLEEGQVRVCHRQLGFVGELPSILVQEILRDSHKDPRYLVLVDATGASAAESTSLQTVSPHTAPATCRLLTTVAGTGIGLGPIIAYARQAFSATRAKC